METQNRPLSPFCAGCYSSAGAHLEDVGGDKDPKTGKEEKNQELQKIGSGSLFLPVFLLHFPILTVKAREYIIYKRVFKIL